MKSIYNFKDTGINLRLKRLDYIDTFLNQIHILCDKLEHIP